MLNTLSSKDQYLQVGRVSGWPRRRKRPQIDVTRSTSLQDYSYRLSIVISEQSSQMQELRKQLSLTEEELHQLKRDKERMMGTETDHLQSLLREKEAFIKVRSFFSAS